MAVTKTFRPLWRYLVGVGVLYLMRVRRQQKHVVHKQLSELSTLLESIPEAVFIFDVDHSVADANSAAIDLCGLSRNQLLERSIEEIAATLRVQREAGSSLPGELAVTRALKGETVRDEKAVCYSPMQPDAPINMLVSAYPMRSDAGRTIGAMVVLRDVTELTQMQERMADSERHLAIGRLASSIAHDFNNVLNTIQQVVAVLELPPETREERPEVYVALIGKAVRRGAEVVQRLRDYVRGGSGELAVVDVSDVLREVLELTRPLLQRDQPISVVTKLRSVDPVRTNATDLRRIFTTLFTKPIPASPKGAELTLATNKPDARVRFHTQKTEAGVCPEARKKS